MLAAGTPPALAIAALPAIDDVVGSQGNHGHQGSHGHPGVGLVSSDADMSPLEWWDTTPSGDGVDTGAPHSAPSVLLAPARMPPAQDTVQNDRGSRQEPLWADFGSPRHDNGDGPGLYGDVGGDEVGRPSGNVGVGVVGRVGVVGQLRRSTRRIVMGKGGSNHRDCSDNINNSTGGGASNLGGGGSNVGNGGSPMTGGAAVASSQPAGALSARTKAAARQRATVTTAVSKTNAGASPSDGRTEGAARGARGGGTRGMQSGVGVGGAGRRRKQGSKQATLTQRVAGGGLGTQRRADDGSQAVSPWHGGSEVGWEVTIHEDSGDTHGGHIHEDAGDMGVQLVTWGMGGGVPGSQGETCTGAERRVGARAAGADGNVQASNGGGRDLELASTGDEPGMGASKPAVRDTEAERMDLDPLGSGPSSAGPGEEMAPGNADLLRRTYASDAPAGTGAMVGGDAASMAAVTRGRSDDQNDAHPARDAQVQGGPGTGQVAAVQRAVDRESGLGRMFETRESATLCAEPAANGTLGLSRRAAEVTVASTVATGHPPDAVSPRAKRRKGAPPADSPALVGHTPPPVAGGRRACEPLTADDAVFVLTVGSGGPCEPGGEDGAGRDVMGASTQAGPSGSGQGGMSGSGQERELFRAMDVGDRHNGDAAVAGADAEGAARVEPARVSRYPRRQQRHGSAAPDVHHGHQRGVPGVKKSATARSAGERMAHQPSPPVGIATLSGAQVLPAGDSRPAMAGGASHRGITRVPMQRGELSLSVPPPQRGFAKVLPAWMRHSTLVNMPATPSPSLAPYSPQAHASAAVGGSSLPGQSNLSAGPSAEMTNFGGAGHGLVVAGYGDVPCKDQRLLGQRSACRGTQAAPRSAFHEEWPVDLL
eukprot:jgi/Mesvir1/2285/Mv19324-RA.1